MIDIEKRLGENRCRKTQADYDSNDHQYDPGSHDGITRRFAGMDVALPEWQQLRAGIFIAILAPRVWPERFSVVELVLWYFSSVRSHIHLQDTSTLRLE